MFLHRNFKKILAVVLSMAIVLSGISFVFNSGTGSKVRFGEEARGANEYTTLTKSDGSTVQIPVQTYNADTNGDGIGDTAYKYVEITESGTWTPPNTKLVDVFLIGGGGGGGYGYYHGGGGGGSGYSTKAYNASVAGSVAISIGAGGAPREPSNMSAGYVIPSGGTTTFISGSTNIQALGGAGGDYLDGGIGGSNGGNGGNGGGSGSERNGQPGEAGKAVDFLGRVHGGGGGGGSAGQNYGGKGGAGQVNGSGKISADLVYFSPFYSSYCGTGGGGYGGGGGGTSSAMRHESVSGWGYYGGFGGQGFCMVRWLSNNAPAILSTSFQQNQVLSETDTNFISRIAASDIDNDTLTCKYYIDSESSPRDIKTMVNSNVTQTVAFSPVDISPLGEGNHTIRFEVEDGKVGKPTTQIMNFKVDKSAPIIGAITGSSSINSITLSGSATDSIGGLDANPYRYTVGSNVSPWGSGTTYTSPGNLVSNMLYEAKFEARDLSGHIAVSTKNIYTKADMPVLSVTNPSSYALEVVTSDNNSDATQYQFSVNGGTKYVTQEGTLTSAPAWITLTGKKVTVTGLTPNQTYSFTAKARNAENIETAISAAASGTTLIAPPGSPANIIATATDKTITVSWDGVSGAIGYDVWVDGSVVNNDTATVFTHANLNPGTPHTYKVRARNAGGPGSWSSPVTKSTLPGSPDIPVNLNAIPLSSSVTITWNNVPGATGYDVEVDGKVVNNGPNTNYIHNSLTSGTHHSYRVRSINPGGKSEWSGYVNTTTLLETVAVPVNFSAVPSVGDITLSWDAVDGASGYDIEVDGVTFDNGNKTAYTQSSLAPGTDHIYRVRAKKGGITSDWSAAVVATTLTDTFGVPANFKAAADNSSVALSWNPVRDAAGYDIEVDGVVSDNGDETTCIHKGLTPGSTHTYRVRAKNDTQVSGWTEPLSVSVFALSTPQNVTAASDENSISIQWQPVEGASGYDVDFDGSIIPGVTSTTYSAIGLSPNSQHVIKVRAVGESGFSNWSTPLTQSTRFTTGNVPVVSGLAKKNSITLMWDKMEGAAAYDVEADGVVTPGIAGASYNITGLEAGTPHTFRVRAQNSSGEGNWSSPFTVSTLPQGPAVPSNVATSSNLTSILVSWDKVAGAEGYDIEVDGTVIENGAGSSYLQKGLSPDTSHTYRVRARNVSGTSQWSAPVTVKTLNSVQTYDINSSEGEEFDLILSGSNIQDLNKYTFTIQYNTDDFEVVDLCGFTPKTDTQEGDISGTDVTVKQVAPGTVVFVKGGSAQSWQVWSGIVNSIRLKAKHGGQAQITYTIQ